MKYIVCKKFNKKGIANEFNLRKGSVCEEIDGVIYYNNEPICYKTSQNAYDYFSRDNDSHGQERFELITNILNKIHDLVVAYNEECASYLDHELTEEEQLEFNAIENKSKEFYDALRVAHPTFLKSNMDVFTFDFYNANLETLQSIYNI